MNPSNRYDFPREQVERLYAELRTTRGLASALGMTKSSAHSLLIRLDIPRLPRPRKKPRPTREQVYEAIVVQRVSMKDAASRFGFSLPILAQVMADYGIASPRWIVERPSSGELRRLYLDEGLSIPKIASQYGCSTTVIRSDLLRYRIPIRPSAFSRFPLPMALETDDCWTWTGSLNRAGYGRVSRDGRTWFAHRWVYEQVKGPISQGMTLDHLCYNRACVNPDHLEPCTMDENKRRAAERRHALWRQQHDVVSRRADDLRLREHGVQTGSAEHLGDDSPDRQSKAA